MGSGIAEVCARAGLDVVVIERDEQAAEAGRARIARSMQRALGAKKISEEEHGAAEARIQVGSDFEAG